MAKLKANGTEVHRFERTQVFDSEENQEQETERVTYSLRSNGKVLYKVDYWHNGRQYGGQWRQFGDGRRFSSEKIERIAGNLKAQGYSRV